MPKGESQVQNITISAVHIAGAERLKFKSIITEFTDIWSQRWNATEVYGRMDPVSFYGGTGRELTLAFDVRGDNAGESAQNMRNAQKLIQYQYPRYGRTQGGQQTIIAAPYFSFQFVNLLNSSEGAQSRTLYGYIKGAVQLKMGFNDPNTTLHFDDVKKPKKIYSSNFNISMRIQVLHVGDLVGFSSPFSLGNNYPYGVTADDVKKAGKQVKDKRKKIRRGKKRKPNRDRLKAASVKNPPVTPLGEQVNKETDSKMEATNSREIKKDSKDAAYFALRDSGDQDTAGLDPRQKAEIFGVG